MFYIILLLFLFYRYTIPTLFLIVLRHIIIVTFYHNAFSLLLFVLLYRILVMEEIITFILSYY